MTEHEFTNAMTFLGDCYGISFPEKQTATWYLFFRDEDFRDFVKACGRLASTSPKKPTISALKSELAEIADPVLGLDMKTEWQKVKKAIANGGEERPRIYIEDEKDREAFERAYGPLSSRPTTEPMDPFTKEVVAEMGGLRALAESTDSYDWMRREFERKFTDRMETRRRILMMSSTQRTDSEVERLALPGE